MENRTDSRIRDVAVVHRKLILREKQSPRANVSGHILASGLGEVEVVRPVVSLRPNRCRCQVSRGLNESWYSRLWNERVGPVADASHLGKVDDAPGIFHGLIEDRGIHYKVIIFHLCLIMTFPRPSFSEVFFIRELMSGDFYDLFEQALATGL